MGFQDRDYVRDRKLDHSSKYDSKPAPRRKTPGQKLPPDMTELFNVGKIAEWLLVLVFVALIVAAWFYFRKS